MWADRFLALSGADAPTVVGPKLLAFQRFFLLAVTTELLWELSRRSALSSPAGFGLLLLFGVVCVLGWVPRLARAAAIAAALLILIKNAPFFPILSNHQYLETLCVFLLALFDHRDGEQRQKLLQSLRWLFLIGLFYSGFQKLTYGYYFQGEFFAGAIATDERFAALFRHLLPAEEFARIRELSGIPSAGPYRVQSPLVIGISNLTYVSEMLLPPMLLFSKTRTLAVALALAFILAIELGAREIIFGSFMVSLALLFTRRNVNGLALPGFVVLFACLAAMVLGLLPDWGLS